MMIRRILRIFLRQLIRLERFGNMKGTCEFRTASDTQTYAERRVSARSNSLTNSQWNPSSSYSIYSDTDSNDHPNHALLSALNSKGKKHLSKTHCASIVARQLLFELAVTHERNEQLRSLVLHLQQKLKRRPEEIPKRSETQQTSQQKRRVPFTSHCRTDPLLSVESRALHLLLKRSARTGRSSCHRHLCFQFLAGLLLLSFSTSILLVLMLK